MIQKKMFRKAVFVLVSGLAIGLSQCRSPHLSSASRSSAVTMVEGDSGSGFKCGRNLFADTTGFRNQSRQNMQRLQDKVKVMTSLEAKLVEMSNRYRPALVHRTTATRYNQIQSSGMIRSPAHSVLNDATAQVSPSSYFSNTEDVLFNSSACVFATLGPWEGRPQYGDIKLRLREAQELERAGDRFIWASSTTGYELAVRQKLSGERLIEAFKATVVVPEDFQGYLNYYMIDTLRRMTKVDRDRVMSQLLAVDALGDPATAGRQWWAIIDQQRLGYLEVKFDQYLTVDFIQSVEVAPSIEVY